MLADRSRDCAMFLPRCPGAGGLEALLLGSLPWAAPGAAIPLRCASTLLGAGYLPAVWLSGTLPGAGLRPAVAISGTLPGAGR